MSDIYFDRNFFVAQFFLSDKFLLITHPKISHSWCKINIHKDRALDTGFRINPMTFELNHRPQNLHSYQNDSKFMKINEIWNNFLQKKEKRDFIILYRNPVDHFISAFIQDFMLKGIHKDSLSFFYNFLNTLPVSTKERDNFLEDMKLKTNFFTPQSFIKYPIIWEHIFKVKFDFYINQGNFFAGHYTPWLSFINFLLNSKKIDENKIKFIDIYDAPLELQLKNYLSNNNFKEEYIFDKTKDGHSQYFNLFKSIINQNSKYRDTVNSILKNDIIYYDTLKKNNKSDI